MNSVYTLPTSSLIISFNIILLITLDSSRHLYDNIFPRTFVGIFYLSPKCTCYVSLHFVLIGLGTNYRALHCTVSPLSCHFFSLWSKYPLTTLFSDTLSLYYSFRMTLLFRCIKITSKITAFMF